MSSEPKHPGDPINEVFPPDSCVARFVVAMAMARNDLDRCRRDAERAVHADAPDFTYRVRLTLGHLVEAVDSLNSYCQEFAEIRALLDRLAPEAKAALKTARGTLQKVGKGVLHHARNNTFHYPKPVTEWQPTSDEHLRGLLSGSLLKIPTDVHVDGDTRAITHTYADHVALSLALGKAADDDEDLGRQITTARVGAEAFVVWADALLIVYTEAIGADFGQPITTAKPEPPQRSS